MELVGNEGTRLLAQRVETLLTETAESLRSDPNARHGFIGFLGEYFAGERRGDTTILLNKRFPRRDRSDAPPAPPAPRPPSQREIASGAEYLTSDSNKEVLVPFTPADLGHYEIAPGVDISFLNPVQMDAVFKICAQKKKNKRANDGEEKKEKEQNFLLFADPGTGKTVIILASKATEAQPRPWLVVVPPSLIWNWEQEYKKYADRLKLAPTVYTNIIEDQREWLTSCGMLIVSQYDYRKHGQEIAARHNITVVIDEAHMGMSARGKSEFVSCQEKVLETQLGRSIAMTGTPVRNGLEVNMMLFFLLYFPFSAIHKQKRLAKVWEMMTSVDHKQRAVGTKILEDAFDGQMFIAPSIPQHMQPYNINTDSFRIHANVEVPPCDNPSFFIRLEAALVHTQEYRALVVKQIVEMHRAKGSKGILLIVTRMAMADALKAQIPDALLFTGDTSDHDKERFLRTFSSADQRGKVGIMTDGMAVGVECTGADVAVMVQPVFSACDQLQCFGRIKRMGQKDNIELYEVCMTEEEYGISKLCESKQDQADALRAKTSGAADDVAKIKALQEKPEDGLFVGQWPISGPISGRTMLSVYQKRVPPEPEALDPKEIAFCAANEERAIKIRAQNEAAALHETLHKNALFNKKSPCKGSQLELCHDGVMFDEREKTIEVRLLANGLFGRVAYRYAKGPFAYKKGELSGEIGELPGQTERLGKHYWTVIPATESPTQGRTLQIGWNGRGFVVIAKVQGQNGEWSKECSPIMFWWAKSSSV